MNSDTAQVRKMLETRLQMRALEDPAFHSRLVADPRAAFEEEMGHPFPAEAKLQVIEEPADTMVLVLLPQPAPDGELSDAQLASISGGTLWDDVKEWFSPPKTVWPTTS